MQIKRVPPLRRLAALASLALVALLAACGNSTATSPFTADQLIGKASTNFAQDSALHFALTATNVPAGLYAITKADGDVVRPDKLKIIGSDMVTQGGTVGIGIIFVGSSQYVDLGNTGNYRVITGLPDLLAIFSPTEGIGAILTQVQSPSVPTADHVNTVACWKITGTVTSSLLAPITGGTGATSNPVQTTLWIGQTDFQIHEVTLSGKAADGDQDSTTRTFVLSNFNENITITAPPVAK